MKLAELRNKIIKFSKRLASNKLSTLRNKIIKKANNICRICINNKCYLANMLKTKQ